jgi:hypothetical protein
MPMKQSLPRPVLPSRMTARTAEPVEFRRASDRVMWHVDGLPQNVVDALWADPDQLITSGTMLKDGDRCTVVRIDPPATPRPLVVKRYNLKGSFHTAVHWFMRSRARWCWLNGQLLREGGVLTPRPLACFEERSSALLRRRSFLLTDFVVGTPLLELARQQEPQPPIRALADQFCTIWRELGALHVGHGDMKASNFIVDPEGQLWLIDLDGMRTYAVGPRLRSERRKDIARFMRNWHDLPSVAAAFRARLGTS